MDLEMIKKASTTSTGMVILVVAFVALKPFVTPNYVTKNLPINISTNPAASLAKKSQTKELIYTNSRTYSAAEHQCLAKNIYFEARDESIKGQVAIGLVTLNRVRSGRYPDDVCSVILQGGDRSRYHCQFSWYCDGLSDKPKNKEAYERAVLIADALLSPEASIVDFTKGATHYHAVYVHPYWSSHMIRTVRIDKHIFYRERGDLQASL